MQRQKQLQQAKQKRALARKLLEAGHTGPEVEKEIKKKFRTGVGSGVLVSLRRELGIPSRLAKPPVATVVEDNGNGSVSSDLKVRLGGIFGWMRAEGINKIHVDLEANEIKVDRTEVLSLE